jgi:PDDEXK-like domain of unknown function (DUF3799)
MQVTPWDGKQISKSGWYSGIPIETYHSAGICDGPAVSSSDLRTCWSLSEKHMFSKWAENPNREERKETNAMLLGGCTHYLLLGEDNFKTKYIAQPEQYPDKKTGELKAWHNGADFCKQWYAKYQLMGYNIVPVKMLEAIVKMAESVALEPLVQADLLRGNVETSGFFFDQQSRIWIKVRPDVIPVADDTFVDLKTTAEVTTPALMKSIRTYGYHQQGGLIWEACEVLGQPFSTFVLLFVETTNPYCARVIELPEEDLSLGRQQNRWCLTRIRAAIDMDRWPGPGEGEVRQLGLAKDERARIRERLKIAGLA